MSMDGKWLYNKLDEEYWFNEGYDTQEAAEAAGIKYAREKGLDGIAIGQAEIVPLPSDIDPDFILEYLEEQYYEECGHSYDDFLFEGLRQEDKDWLKEKMEAVIKEFYERIQLEPSWYLVRGTYEIDAKKEDLHPHDRVEEGEGIKY